ncbi:MAG: signal peptidase I [Ruminococcaceae bacterium]|nr:signal peptidase I [Oscillospiraceae bacterium]
MEKPRKKKKINVGKATYEIYEWSESIVISLVVVILIFTFIFRIVGVDGDSMLPTLHHQDRVILSSFFYEPAPRDIVVITQPNSVHKPIIKRIIATEYQTVDIDFETGVVYVDGAELLETYISEPIDPAHRGDMEFPLTLGEGEVFVLGDNRNNSLDSRYSGIGIIKEEYILGKAVFRLFPISGFGFLGWEESEG